MKIRKPFIYALMIVVGLLYLSQAMDSINSIFQSNQVFKQVQNQPAIKQKKNKKVNNSLAEFIADLDNELTKHHLYLDGLEEINGLYVLSVSGNQNKILDFYSWFELQASIQGVKKISLSVNEIDESKGEVIFVW